MMAMLPKKPLRTQSDTPTLTPSFNNDDKHSANETCSQHGTPSPDTQISATRSPQCYIDGRGNTTGMMPHAPGDSLKINCMWMDPVFVSLTSPHRQRKKKIAPLSPIVPPDEAEFDDGANSRPPLMCSASLTLNLDEDQDQAIAPLQEKLPTPPPPPVRRACQLELDHPPRHFGEDTEMHDSLSPPPMMALRHRGRLAVEMAHRHDDILTDSIGINPLAPRPNGEWKPAKCGFPKASEHGTLVSAKSVLEAKYKMKQQHAMQQHAAPPPGVGVGPGGKPLPPPSPTTPTFRQRAARRSASYTSGIPPPVHLLPNFRELEKNLGQQAVESS